MSRCRPKSRATSRTAPDSARTPRAVARCWHRCLARQMDTVRRPVVVHDLRVVDRDVGGPTVEIVDGITPFAHHLGHQTVGDADRGRGVVDEPGLHLAPAGGELRQGRRRQRNNVELVPLAFARRKFLLGAFLASGLRSTTRSYSGRNAVSVALVFLRKLTTRDRDETAATTTTTAWPRSRSIPRRAFRTPLVLVSNNPGARRQSNVIAVTCTTTGVILAPDGRAAVQK